MPADPAADLRARGWRTLTALHGALQAALEPALVKAHGLSAVEYTVLDELSRQDGWHLRMQQLARVVALSPSATTRLVTRLEERGLLTRVLCEGDRRGIYSELTPAGAELLAEARVTHDRELRAALADAERSPELAPLVTALLRLPPPASDSPAR